MDVLSNHSPVQHSVELISCFVDLQLSHKLRQKALPLTLLCTLHRCFRIESQFAHQDGTTHKGMKHAWPGHTFQALVKAMANCQALKTAWQGHSFQALVKLLAKCLTLKTAWQCHFFPALPKVAAKCQALKTAWQVHSF